MRTASLLQCMPVIVGAENWAKWLREEPASKDELKAMLKPFPSERVAVWQVDRRVGNVNNEDAALSEPIATASSVRRQPRQGSLF